MAAASTNLDAAGAVALVERAARPMLSEVRPRWSEVEAGWLEVGAGDSADILRAEEEHARIVALRRDMEGLWRAGAESDSQAGMVFGRQLDGVLRAGTGSGFSESCAQWQFQGRRSIETREEERRRLEARRRELEIMRGKLEIDKREWEVRRRENEVRRRELEVMRRGAEADRVALETLGGKDSEEYWRGVREYERVLFEDYASVFAGALKDEEEEYSNFMNGAYLAGQHDYVKGMAEVLAGYSALLWGCETDWGGPLF